MSAFLGPIHFWVFNKVQVQDKLVEQLIEYTEIKGFSGNLRKELLDRFGELENEPLEKIIDECNIHGWLQERVTMVEQRLAYAVTELLRKNTNVLPDIQELFYKVGSGYKPDRGNSVAEGFRYLNDTLLDGMPCDRANDIISESDEEVIWRRSICVHEQYWEAVGGDIAIYYLLRESFIKGMLEGSSFIYEKIDGVTNRLGR